MSYLTPEQTVELERLIDSTSLTAVLNALTEICHGKAEHVSSAWQDRNLSARWQTAARLVDILAAKAARDDL